ncbi:Ig-like domain-containing protein [Candidatus Parcubacteria bacterium]|nr:Ig-like domain-containing protein [Candidatus Parcubacteria bacterium]
MKNKIIIAVGVLLIFLIGGMAVFYLLDKETGKRKLSDYFKPAPNYAQAYTLVNDKISQNANIAINLPPDINSEKAKTNIVFTPEIKGQWLDSVEEQQIVFKPETKLKIGKYYSVALNSSAGTIGKDFLIDENPEITAIFPKKDSETHEKSDITIIFNRPMVPLTTLDVMYESDVPIEINPPTLGKFKWISTKALQFQPNETLIPSSNYNVVIKPGFTSMDGLLVNELSHTFITRKLRYEYVNKDKIIYNQPIGVKFNQPIDINQTRETIKLHNNTTDKNLEFIVEYGVKKIYNPKDKEYIEEKDESTLLIYNKKDRHGRKKLWDFTNNYQLTINKAYPARGDIIIEEPKQINFIVSDIISSISATSEQTNFAAQDFFDAQGKLVVDFYEDINLDKSKIESEKLVSIEYGEKCKEQENDYYYAKMDECEKIPDKARIRLTFQSDKINYSENLEIIFKKIINSDGLQINKEKIIEYANVIPKLRILSTIPANNAGSSQHKLAISGNNMLTLLIICSNSPLNSPAKEDIDYYLTIRPDYEYKSWSRPVLVPKNYTGNYYKCARGTFESRINYGLMPETEYTVNLKIVDHFNNKDARAVKFTTGTMPQKYLNFYHFQKDYTVTVPDKTKLTYAVENMEFVNLHICKLAAEDMLNHLDNKPAYWEPASIINNCITIQQDKIELPKRFWIKNYFQVNLKDYFTDTRGHYILTFSHPNYVHRYNGKKVNERTYITVTNLNVVEKKININENYSGTRNSRTEKNLTGGQKASINNLYWVTDLDGLNPIKNARVELYQTQKDKAALRAATFYTNDFGIAETTAINNLLGAVVSDNNGNDAIVMAYYNKFEYSSSAYNAQKIYVYTDRPIYRPGHKVHIKGLYRVGFDGDYEIFREKKIPLIITDSRNNEIYNEELTVNEFGTFSADIELDAEAPLGRYRIKTKDMYAYFDVEEYIPAPFKIETKIDKEEYISGDTFTLDMKAGYYFGVPLDGGEVTYSIGSQNYHFDKYKGEYFNFGNSWQRCFWGCDYNDKFILRNKTKLDSNGKARISHQLDFNKLFGQDEERKSKIFVVYLTIKNENGQSVSAQKSFVVHNAEFYLGLKTDKSFLGKNESFELKVKSVDTNGHELSVNNIDLTINKMEWVRNRRKEVDGGYYYKWEKKLTPIEQKKINTDKQGNWRGDFSIKEEGQFEIVIKAADKRGNMANANYNLYVYGEKRVDIEPSNDDTLDLAVEKTNLNVNDEASFIIKSPYKSAKALVSIERGKIFDYEIIDVNQGLYNYRFDIIEEYIPNIYASVVLVSPEPDVKYNKIQFNINTEKKTLDIQVKSNKDYYLPGEEVILDFEVKNSSGKGVKTELSVAVADLSVLALKGNPKKNPVTFFYGGLPLTVSTAANLKSVLHEIELNDSVSKAEGAKGGGGAESEDLAKKKRGIFKDTALWRAVIVTDDKGKANIKFNLPDNLTTWQIESIGLTKDTRLGVGYKEITSRKELMLTPLKPRFIIPGDEFSIGAKVYNQTGQDQRFDVRLADSSFNLEDDSNKSLALKDKESNTIYFNVSAPHDKQDGIHVFTVSAQDNIHEDTVEKTIKIRRNDTYEAVATAGYTKGDKASEYIFLPNNIIKDKGELTIKTSATLAVFLSDALNYMLSFPYGCSEQIASKLSTIAVIKKGLALENIGDKFELKKIEYEDQTYTIDELVEIGLNKIYQNQKNDGGFNYYAYGQSNFYLSLHIVNTFKQIQDAGYNVDEEKIKKAYNFLENRINYGHNLYDNKNTVILTAYTLSQWKSIKHLSPALANKIKTFIQDEKFISEDISNTSLVCLAMLATDNPSIFNSYKQKIYNTLENRIEIDSRGSYLSKNETWIWQYYETPIKNTALLLKALVKDKRDNAILDNIMRWLLRSRNKDGAWGSTNNTLSVVDAFTDYLLWQEENKSDFELKVALDNKEIGKFGYDPANILQQDTIVMPLDEMRFGAMTPLTFNRTNRNKLNNNFYYDVSLKYFLPIDTVPPRDEGFTITRELYALDDEEYKYTINSAKVGDILRGHIKIITPKARNFVAIEDFIPAGVELINFNLDTENEEALTGKTKPEDNYGYMYRGGNWRDWQRSRQIRPDAVEMRDDRLFLFKERLSEGTYEYDYYVRILIPGKFHHLPAVASEMYFPENFGRTRGGWFGVE